MNVSHTMKANRMVLVVGVCLMALLFGLIVGVAAAAQGEALFPSLSDNKKGEFKKSGVVINHGNSSQGYVMVKYKESSKRLKVRITLNKKNYDYDLNGSGEFEVFPLQMGDGKYKITVFEEGKQRGKYAQLASTTVSVKLDSPHIPFLYPNQYVHYTAESLAVAKSYEVCEGLTDEKEIVKAVYAFCSRQISYHYARANSAKSGYLPDIDEVVQERKGICFDYAALMACMLRVQGIPTQLVIGYADKTYHAWNNVLVDGKWYRFDATYNSMGNKANTYVEERSY